MKTNLKNVMTMLTVLILVCGSAQAVLITNGATTVLSDGFEAHGVGVPPPGPPHGSWSYDIYKTNVLAVWDGSTAPGPYEGSKYMEVRRGTSQPWVAADFDPQTSGTVKLTLMANTGPDGQVPEFKIIDSASGAGFRFLFAGHATYLNGGVLGVYTYGVPGGLQILGLPWVDGVWTKVEFEYTLGAPTATLTVDDGTAATGVLSTNNGPISSLDQLVFTTDSTYGGEINVDAVPEPATMILLSLGGLGLLRRRKA